MSERIKKSPRRFSRFSSRPKEFWNFFPCEGHHAAVGKMKDELKSIKTTFTIHCHFTLAYPSRKIMPATFQKESGKQHNRGPIKKDSRNGWNWIWGITSEGETLEDNNRSFPLPTSNRNQDPGSSSWEVAKNTTGFSWVFRFKKK